MDAPRRALAVCGPTASGKSALSISLARELDGEVVNVDSVQMYRGLDVGSAKLPLSERGGVPHHVLDIFEPDRPANVAEFRAAALSAIGDITSRGKLPLLVGGSGMYFTVLLHGLADLPATSPEIRAAVGTLSLDEMWCELESADPVTTARLNPNDRQRISRALEVFRMTGRKPSEIVAEHSFVAADVTALVLVLCRPRQELYERINRRAHSMLSDGLIEETEEILHRYGRVPPLETLGYKQASDFLQGLLNRDAVAGEISLHTRRFAKRQMTYWRNEPAKRGWLVRPAPDEQGEEVVGAAASSRRGSGDVKGFRAFRFSEAELIKAVAARLKEPLLRTEIWYILPS